jgi:flagellar motor switch protein FliG
MASNPTARQAPELSGTERAAIFLMTLGEDAASQVLRHLGPKEVQSIGSAMAAIPAINRTQLASVVQEFTSVVDDQTPIGVGSDEYLRKVLVAALGEDRARSLIDRILVGGNSSGLES